MFGLPRSSSQSPAAVLWEHKVEVRALAFEDPWLSAAMSDGTVLLLDVEAAMRARRTASQRGQAAAGGAAARTLAAPGYASYCVDIADQWLAAGERKAPSDRSFPGSPVGSSGTGPFLLAYPPACLSLTDALGLSA